MARFNIRKPTAVASIAALMALAALPTSAMAEDPGSGWRGNGRAASAQGQNNQSRPAWRGNGEARGNSGQSQAERSRDRAAAASQAPQQRARPEQRNPSEQRNSSANWRGRGGDGNAPPSAVARPPMREAQAGRPSGTHLGTPTNGVEQRRYRAQQDRVQQDRAQQERDRANAVRRDDNRDRDRQNATRPGYNRDRDDNRTNGWTGNRYDSPQRYDNSRVVNGQRRDDDRRWSYSNGRYQWNKNWRNDKRYDWRGYRTQYRYIYSPGYYRAPYSNYYYRPMLVGGYLNSGFYGNSYWLSDPWEYRLPQAYGPYRWIRYFDDALLVNIHTGMVVDTIRNFFW